VLFCDLVDSTRLASRLDPEDLREVIRAYQATCAEVIQRFDGHIAQYLGDGLLVYFGYPQAHEDDAQRAVRTGLAMVQALGPLNRRLEQGKGVRLAVRVGIHTSLVVVGEIGGGHRQEQLALGETPNLAARLQGLAAPDAVVVSAATFHLVRGYFTAQELGAQSLPGVTAPVRVYRMLGESAAQSRLDIAAAAGLTPLVGRESEVLLLLERWAHSQDGRGQAVLLSGEPGIGKSRLVEVLRQRVSSQGATRMMFRCSPYHQQSALYPVIEHLQRVLHWDSTEAHKVRLEALEQALRTSRLPLAEVTPLVAALLSLPHPAHYPPLNLPPQRQRQKTHDALVAWLLDEAARQPVLAVWEDLHWADPSTLEVLGLVLDQVPTARMFTVLTCRPEFRPPWATRSHLTQITLTRLGRAQVEVMILSLTGGKALPAAVVEQVVAKTDGVPLFVEELTKMVLESGLLQEREACYALTGPPPPLAIPATLQDSLMARLDRLTAVKAVAQLGATIGRTFPYELLQAVASLDDGTLQQGMRQLVEVELVYQHGVPPQATYTFKHALIQDAAYQSLLKSTRQQYHQRIAQVLEAQFPETAATQPELLAHHYTEAGLPTQAIPFWQKAGLRASERSAYVEALAHLTAGLALLPLLPATPARTQQELDFQLALGPVLAATKGNAAPEVGQVYTRARTLCQEIGATPQHFPVLVGLWRFALIQGEFRQAHELSLELFDLANRARDAAQRLEAQRALGMTLYFLGDLMAARAPLEQGMRLYHPQQHRAHAALYGRDPGVDCYAYAALTLGLLGYPDQARVQMHTALTLAEQLASPLMQGWVLVFMAWLHQFHRAERLTQEWAEAALVLAHKHGFPQVSAMGRILHGWACAMQGDGASGVAEMHQGLAAWRATGTEIARPSYLALLAEWYGSAGQGARGLEVLAEARAAAQHRQERFYEAEFYRLEGVLLLTQSVDRVAEATTCFQHALTLARQQQAQWWALRAAMSLSRLWQQQGKQTEARALLAPIYGWFTEGFDTADLQEAKALLAALEGEHGRG
jgi:predicted ATPase/class 3 adenylate cyclase